MNLKIESKVKRVNRSEKEQNFIHIQNYNYKGAKWTYSLNHTSYYYY